jgi:hypothetical protein
MDAFRKQLDVLMGANRNGDVEEVNRNYYDRDVCRLFLAGLCPHDLFQLTVRSSPLFGAVFPAIERGRLVRLGFAIWDKKLSS